MILQPTPIIAGVIPQPVAARPPTDQDSQVDTGRNLDLATSIQLLQGAADLPARRQQGASTKDPALETFSPPLAALCSGKVILKCVSGVFRLAGFEREAENSL